MAGLSEEQFLESLAEQSNTDVAEESNNIEDQQINNDEQIIDQGQEQEPELELSPTEQKAYDQGWRPQEDFSGPEENWKTAKEYVKDGEWLAKLKEANQRTDKLEQQFNERLENTNKLNAARNKSEIAKLKKQQRESVDNADTEAFDNAQAEIESLEAEALENVTPKTEEPKTTNPTIAAWEGKNPWINDVKDERTSVAQALWGTFQQQNPTATIEQALAHVDSKIGILYPQNNNNLRREQPNSTETPRRTSQRRNKELTMGDLTANEKQDYQMFGHTMFTEKEFLTAVKDARAK